MHPRSRFRNRASRFQGKAIGRLRFTACVAAIALTSSTALADQKQISLVDISQNSPTFGSVFPQVKVSPSDPDVVAVAWRRYGLPVNTNADKDARTADCHVSVSFDSGDTFRDINLMPFLRQPAADVGEPEPDLYFCNAPWVAFGSGPVMYAGGSGFTPLGVIGPLPKQGRALVTVSTDFGATWSAPTYGIRFDNFAPGLTGLGGGTAPPDTPWDGSNGLVDPQSLTFYSTSGAYVSASTNEAQTFDTVYELTSASLPGWTVTRVGVMNAAFGVLGAPFVATASPVEGSLCPCLGYATSTDHGKTWTAQLVAEADQFNNTVTGDTARSPFSASDPSAPGHVAIAAYTPDHESVLVFYTQNGGREWKSAVADVPADVPIAIAKKVGVGYTLDGRILIVWRGYQDSGAFDTFAAMVHGNHFGPTIRISPQSSIYPYLTTLAACNLLLPPTKACYDTSNGGGDFITWITGNHRYAFVAFPYMPGGLVEDTYLAKIPLSLM